MDGPRDYHTKWSQRRRNTEWYPLYVDSKKKWYNWTYLQNRNRLIEKEFMVAKGEGRWEGIVREFGMDVYILLYSEWITSKDLLHSTWNSDQCYGASCWEGGLGEKGYVDTCVCIAESLCWSPETTTRLLIGYTPVQNKTFFKSLC